MPSGLLIIFGLEPSEWLALVGGVLEMVGFALVAVELVRAQRRELGTAGPFQFLVDAGRSVKYRVRKLFGKVKTHEGSATLSGTVKVAARGRARASTKSEYLGERLRVLEQNFARLDGEVDQHRLELDRRIEEEAQTLKASIDTVRANVEAREADAKEAFKASATLQWWGIGLFVIGAVCSAAANVAY